MKISDLRIIVTGAASGMGRTFALELAREGASVMAVDMNPEGLSSLSAEAEGFSGRVATHAANVASEGDVAASIKATVDAFGSVNGVVNNAGIFRDALLVKKDRNTGAVKKMTLENWQKVIDVDLTGPFLFTRDLAAVMIENGWKPGVVINISSVSRAGNPGQSNYSAAKAGLVADTALWGKELAQHGIRVGAIAPGFIDTPILQGMRPEMLDKMLSVVPMRRAGKPEEIYAALRFIVECDYFTGRCVDVDGGLTL